MHDLDAIRILNARFAKGNGRKYATTVGSMERIQAARDSAENWRRDARKATARREALNGRH